MGPRIIGLFLTLLLVMPGNLISGQDLTEAETAIQETAVLQPGRTARNAIYLELAGPGVLYTLNYERFLTEHLSLRAGFSIWSVDSLDIVAQWIKNFKYRSFPVMVTWLIGKKASHLELGLGIQPTFLEGDFDVFYFIHANEKSKGSGILGLSTIGYRYQKEESGFIFRIGMSPVFSTSGVNPAVGLSLGYGF